MAEQVRSVLHGGKGIQRIGRSVSSISKIFLFHLNAFVAPREVPFFHVSLPKLL